MLYGVQQEKGANYHGAIRNMTVMSRSISFFEYCLNVSWRGGC